MIEQLECFPIAYTVAYYKGLGWVPIGYRNGKEIYRGEYRPTADEALASALAMNL